MQNYLVNSKKSSTFAPAFKKKRREVAQLVAHYVRDVGVGCSSHLFSTKKTVKRLSFLKKGRLNIAIYG